jgi:outer membrane PBP1 activator LpoA protein
MDFSMHIITRLLSFLTLVPLLVGCGGGNRWSADYDDAPVGMPAELQYGSFSAGLYGTSDTHTIAVLLPTSGPKAAIGKTILPAIEAAYMQFAPSELQMTFYDTGTDDVSNVIQTAVASNPEVIIGPVFDENTKVLRDIKPTSIPALSFTSDTSAVGDGVFSMAVMPSNTIEAILQEMNAMGGHKFIILAPNTPSGQVMAGAAKSISNEYDIETAGIFYYNERDTESIKTTAMDAAMYTARNAANTRAKEILSAILNHENLSPIEKSSMARQLERINRTDTLGTLPYDSVLFLGNADDTKSLASFLRYYGLGVRDAQFYGTPMWEDSNIASDITMTGAVFATLPEISPNFANLYESATGTKASRMAAIGYDATILAIGATYSANGVASYLMMPGGYLGTTGLFRLRPNGLNERALQIERLNGDGTATVAKTPVAAFTLPIYKTSNVYISPANEMSLNSPGVNPMDYITIPERFKGKYRSKTYYATKSTVNNSALEPATVLPKNEDSFTITADGYKPVPLENVSRTYIDSVEVSE